MKNSSFSEDNTYKLYRDVYDIVHPSISKKNISNYSIVLKDDITPIRVFYPKKPTLDTSIVLFVPSSTKIFTDKINYSKVCKDISKNTNSIVLGIDYNSSSNSNFNNCKEECYKTIKYLYKELKKNKIKEDKIVLMGDSLGANIITSIINKIKEDNLNISKVILTSTISDKTDDIEKNKVNVIQLNKFKDFFDNFIDENSSFYYPIDENNFENYPKVLLFSGAADPLYEKIKNYYEILKKNNVEVELIKITFADHNILNNNDQDIKDELYKNILEFLNS